MFYIITLDFKTSSKNYNVKIYDATGRMIKILEHINSSEITLDIVDFKSGIYLLNVFDGNYSSTYRFIKQ